MPYPEGDSNVCDELKEKRQNRKVVVYYPAETFMNYGGKKLQDSALSQQYNHESDGSRWRSSRSCWRASRASCRVRCIAELLRRSTMSAYTPVCNCTPV